MTRDPWTKKKATYNLGVSVPDDAVGDYLIDWVTHSDLNLVVIHIGHFMVFIMVNLLLMINNKFACSCFSVDRNFGCFVLSGTVNIDSR